MGILFSAVLFWLLSPNLLPHARFLLSFLSCLYLVVLRCVLGRLVWFSSSMLCHLWITAGTDDLGVAQIFIDYYLIKYTGLTLAEERRLLRRACDAAIGGFRAEKG